MREEYEQLLPKWYQSSSEYDLVLSDDIDSLASCAVLNMIKGWKVKYFYDFNSIYKSNVIQEKKNNKCWVDIAISKGRAFDNHVSKITEFEEWNKDMINLNQMFEVTNENYTDKYAGSTLLLVWSLYKLPMPESEVGKMILLCVDSAYKGFYSPKFADTQKHYLMDVMGLNELYSVLCRHTAKEFEELITEYGLRSKIIFSNNKIQTLLPLERIEKELGINLHIIPEIDFHKCVELKQIQAYVSEDKWFVDDIDSDIRTLAITYKNRVKYSKIKERR